MSSHQLELQQCNGVAKRLTTNNSVCYVSVKKQKEHGNPDIEYTIILLFHYFVISVSSTSRGRPRPLPLAHELQGFRPAGDHLVWPGWRKTNGRMDVYKVENPQVCSSQARIRGLSLPRMCDLCHGNKKPQANSFVAESNSIQFNSFI